MCDVRDVAGAANNNKSQSKSKCHHQVLYFSRQKGLAVRAQNLIT
jgi:hypothetical protein